MVSDPSDSWSFFLYLIARFPFLGLAFPPWWTFSGIPSVGVSLSFVVLLLPGGWSPVSYPVFFKPVVGVLCPLTHTQFIFPFFSWVQFPGCGMPLSSLGITPLPRDASTGTSWQNVTGFRCETQYHLRCHEGLWK